MSARGKSILIVGGGFSGMSAAIQFRKAGAIVDLVEIDPGWRSYGAGISMGGASLRALRTIGVLDAFRERGAVHDGAELRTADDRLIATLPTPRLAGPDVPGEGGILRPELAAILAEATRASGAHVKLGSTFERLEDGPDGVRATLSDGATATYDLVIGADGLGSRVRETVAPEAPKPRYVGQAVWRALAPTPPDIQRTTMWMSPSVKVGVNPISRDQMYLFLTENRPNNDRIEPSRFVPMLTELLAPFASPVIQTLRGHLGEGSSIVYRPLEWLLLPRPWYRGRVVLIGDAVHATTPHLASGACMGFEDAIVLAEEVDRAESLPAALAAFEARRWERCRLVVENSVRLADIEISGGSPAEHGRLMKESFGTLAAPI